MSWQKKLMQKLVRQHQRPCPNCGQWMREDGKLRLLPFRDVSSVGIQPIPGKIFTKKFVAEARKKIALATNNAVISSACELDHLAEVKVRSDQGTHVIDCPGARARDGSIPKNPGSCSNCLPRSATSYRGPTTSGMATTASACAGICTIGTSTRTST